jgi:hypothetical protein
VAKHLIDTDLYIDLIQSGITLPLIREIYDKETPGIYFSSVVAQELLAGARSPGFPKPLLNTAGSSVTLSPTL